MLIQGQVGPSSAQSASPGTNPTVRVGQLGDVVVSELHGRYYEQAYRGSIFTISVVTAATITAYVGAAGGTPQIAIYNPAGSNKNLVLLQASVLNVVAASAAGTSAWGIYYGQTAAITASSNAVPYNTYTLRQGGSVATGFTATALTSGSAATGILPIATYYWATAAGAFFAPPSIVDINGSIIIPPGGYAALGGSGALTSATWSSSLTWEEVPI